MLITLIIGLAGTLIVLALAGRRILWLYRLISSGQAVLRPVRFDDVGARVVVELEEVPAQRKLLKWTVPGIAHFFTMWAFLIMATVYLEAYGALFDEHFEIPLLRRVHLAPILGFLQDFIAIACAISLGVFAILRIQQAPERQQRKSRFYGSHTGGAWLILFMIFNVVWTMFVFRGAAAAADHFDNSGAFFSNAIGRLLEPLGQHTNEVLDRVGLIAHIGVMLIFLLIVLHSKHLHIFVAPVNVAFKRLPDGLGPLLPVVDKGEPVNFEDPPEDAVLGRGKIDDFAWKGFLDFATCTECGRCQSQCPAWNTGKPLSPKLVIMNLRDHMFAKAPYLIEGATVPEGAEFDSSAAQPLAGHHVPESGFERVGGSGPEQALRPLVGTAEQGGVIDPDVLWSCTTCGACVNQCPVDIEHIDHIVDMRRYQVMMESEFPGELGVLFKNLENKGNPWGQNNSGRLDWAKDLPFEVPVYEGDLADEVEYLYFVGCAGAFEDKAKKTAQATAELLYRADVNYVVLGTSESCTGDSARRAGNEFLFQQLAQQTIATLDDVFEGRAEPNRKIVTTCPHCLNTLGREYPQLGAKYEVVHHTQLLNRLVRDGKLVPVKPADGAATVTYHDPCYLGRHNKVYAPPRELIAATGMVQTEMPRHADRSFCCGAGGARMWMEEHLGKRVNLDRVDEAISTLGATGSVTDGAGTVATGCPFCKVMVDDGLTQRADEGTGVGIGVQDVAQLLLEAVQRGEPELPQHAPKIISRPKPKAEPEPVAEPDPTPAAPAAAPVAAASAGKGLAMKGAAKRPGAKAPGAKAPAAPAAAEPAAPVKGLAMKGAAKRPGAKAPGAKAPGKPAAAAPAETSTPAAPPVKGLAMKGAAKRPGAKAPGAKAPGKPAAAAPAETSTPAAPPVKGLAMKGAAKRPGAKAPGANAPGAKAPSTPATAPVAAAPVTDDAVPAADAIPDEPAEAAMPTAKPGGLGFKSGAKAPGKRN
ncbi:(Fe-S)-binding protein [Skermania piniformis]